MIYGLGTDIIELARIAAALERFGARFASRILCEPELVRFRQHRQPVAYLARRFAAKEAFGKALGTGVQTPAGWRGVWVSNLRSGKPVLEYTPALAALLAERGIRRSHVSLSDQPGMASATVILECDA